MLNLNVLEINSKADKSRNIEKLHKNIYTIKMADDEFIQTFFGEDKFEQRIPFMIKGKPKSIINLYFIT